MASCSPGCVGGFSRGINRGATGRSRSRWYKNPVPHLYFVGGSGGLGAAWGAGAGCVGQGRVAAGERGVGGADK